MNTCLIDGEQKVMTRRHQPNAAEVDWRDMGLKRSTSWTAMLAFPLGRLGIQNTIHELPSMFGHLLPLLVSPYRLFGIG
jgi:hypothetical protein